nr:ABC transporter ATP-binding protein [Brucella melitensis]
MTRFRIDFRGPAFRSVLGYTFSHWRSQPLRLSAMIIGMLLATAADVLTPLYSGRLVDSLSLGSNAWDAAIHALIALLSLGALALVSRQVTFYVLTDFTLKIMSDMAASAFRKLQRFSTDWHANAFAGSTVRKVTRGMWALDLLNDTLIIALLPSLLMLVGSVVLLAWFWPLMGLMVAIGSVLYIACTIVISLGFVTPAATLANSWDTRMGGALADSMSCNAVVKAFGAEAREDERLAMVVNKWRSRTRRTWLIGTLNGFIQGTNLLVIRGVIIAFALYLWTRGQATAGDITSFSPPSSCCKAICAMWACISATCNARSITWRNWSISKPSPTALPTSPARPRSGSAMARSPSITSPSIMAGTKPRSTATSRCGSKLASGSVWRAFRLRQDDLREAHPTAL